MTFEALDRLIELANADALSNSEFNALVDAVPGLVRVARAAQEVVVVAGRYAPDGVPVSRAARNLYDALASLEDADTKGGTTDG